MQLKPIDQQVVVMVGASSGIGRDAALALGERGAQVVVAARSQDGLASLVEQIKQMGGEAIAVVADVAEFDQVKAIADTAITTFGRIDTWVHCAAAGMVAPFETVTIEEFRRVIDVTLMGQIYGAKVALPHLKQAGGGSLIAISSMEGRRALPLQSAYSTAKHGLEGFLESLRVELEHEGYAINVTSIKPAVINTPFYNHARSKIGVKPSGIPPYYDARLVTEAILYTAEHPVRDFIVGDVGRLLDWSQRLSPGLVDFALRYIGFNGQRTDDLKSPQAPDGLFETMPGYDQVEGDFGHLTIPSVSDWLVKLLPGR
ncbi:SDR family oxidoreductase [Leptolyngbya sp. CCNP1308]|uniref:SDR family oxidoreductase n=1 Tax=Leptolyngbya sp. CCNP1308 TaxID=3110255 RepID=UPI002B1FF50B|nr:SDR family oxidoreductase [Leptolyngbya sp. CCNP1308]MEA5451719.1 SDR family oxidoreductase [Leptolyngbya sp. CCNP1308]